MSTVHFRLNYPNSVAVNNELKALFSVRHLVKGHGIFLGPVKIAESDDREEAEMVVAELANHLDDQLSEYLREYFAERVGE